MDEVVKKERKHTVEAVKPRCLAERSLTLSGAVADVVPFLHTADEVSVSIDLVRL